MTLYRSVLIVDDDLPLRVALADYMAANTEFKPEGVGNLGDAETVILKHQPQFKAIILDVGLPDGDGREFCAKVRRWGVKTPIIMLTGSVEEQDVVEGLKAGANDYVCKPFRLNELFARLRAQVRNFENGEYVLFQIGPYTFRPSSKLLHEPIKNRRIKLTGTEAAILKQLCRAGGGPVGRQDLLNEVWGHNSGATAHSLETQVYRLRQKIEPDPAQAKVLLTSRDGYRLDPSALSLVT